MGERRANSFLPLVRRIVALYNTSGDFDCALMQAFDEYPSLADYFVIDRKHPGSSFQLKDRYLFPRNDPVVAVQFLRDASLLTLKWRNRSLLPALKCFAELVSSASVPLRAALKVLDPELKSLLKMLLDEGVVVETEATSASSYDAPGLYRLQHASVLFRSLSTSVLIDPHFQSFYTPGRLRRDITRADLGRIDAVLLSHTHEDHYNLASLMQFPLGTLFIVPRIPRRSFICDDVVLRLRSLGYRRIVAPEWGSSPIVIGDIEVRALPFYGEQPTVTEPGWHKELRNWGNTYHISQPGLTSLVLIDSGTDALGSMLDVADRVRRTLPAVDVVLSNLRSFTIRDADYVMMNGAYWLSLSSDQMRRFACMLGQSLTLGAIGVAEVCKLLGARTFLPYAHWWQEISDVPEGEEDLLSRLRRALIDVDAQTTCGDWRIGDRFRLPSQA